MLHVSFYEKKMVFIHLNLYHSSTDLHKLKLVHTDIKPENVMLVDAASKLERVTVNRDKSADKRQVSAVDIYMINLN